MGIIHSPDTVPHGQRVSAVFSREGEDVATIGQHYILLADGEAIDWDAGAYERVETNLQGVWDAINDGYGAEIALDRFLWHDFGVDIRRPNPAHRETVIGTPVLGGDVAADQLPPQCAMSVTFKTARRRTWGRNYLPAPSKDKVSAGRFLEAWCDTVRTAFGELIDDQATHDCPLVIWSPRHGGGALQYGDGTPAGRAAAHAAGLDNPDSSSFAFTVDQVQVDDVVDVIRSRRFDTALVKATHTTGA